jgi:hypothetical protein
MLKRYGGWAVALGLAVVSIAFVAWTRMQPEYDAYGWLVWGRQALHGNLNTNGAPSWKPLTFLFTFPYALAGSAQPWLWMVTAVAAALSASVFAARIAYRLSGPCPGRPYAPFIAAAFAAVGVLGIGGYWPQILISSSDPMIVALCLAAIDCHLHGRRRLAFVALVLAALGRPEAWLFTGLYGVWVWRADPRARALVVAGLALVPALWFGISALTAKSWLQAGDLALNNSTALRGDVISGVLDRLSGLYELPMQLAAALGLGFAIARRDRAVLVLAAAAVTWVAVEIAFAFHGWPAQSRYLLEPAAVLVVIAGTGVARLIAAVPAPAAPLRWAGVVPVVILLAALVPVVHDRISVARAAINQRRHAGILIGRLEDLIDEVGGAGRIRACGQPTSLVGYQSTLAFELGMNVGYVGHKPGKAIHQGEPIVLFKPHDLGWEVRPIHMLSRDRVACDRLRADSPFGQPSATTRQT